jgi:glycosyltransferase involved in cell wall biosynthesis
VVSFAIRRAGASVTGAFRPCAIIPTRNHYERLAGVVAGLRGMDLPIFIVDDGSAPAARDVIAAFDDPAEHVAVMRRPVNGGKGAAMMTGFRRAIAEGFTHALQIDADGQHDPDQAADFLATSRARPEAVVSGGAVYDDSVPKTRKYGRYITHVCVWVETMSRDISDSMCGYRLYPLAAVAPLLSRGIVGARMEFDTEIIVHLHWAGVPVIMRPVKVVYPEGNASNFRMFRDNVRISLMHTRLLCQAPLRLLCKARSLYGNRRVGRA